MGNYLNKCSCHLLQTDTSNEVNFKQVIFYQTKRINSNKTLPIENTKTENNQNNQNKVIENISPSEILSNNLKLVVSLQSLWRGYSTRKIFKGIVQNMKVL